MENSGCSLESMFFGTVTVGERGQVVIPSEARKRFGLNTGDKLLVFGHPSEKGIFMCKIDAMEHLFEALRRTLQLAQEQPLERAEDESSD